MMKKILNFLLVVTLCTGIAIAEATLPAYVYPGNDPVEAAVSAYSVKISSGSYILGDLAIPAPVIHQTEAVDDSHLLVYGTFWIFNYSLEGDTLYMQSGGEHPGIMTLEKTENGWTVAAFEQAGVF